MKAEEWLRSRLRNAPPGLLETMVAALPDGVEPVSDALAGAAMNLYGQVVELNGGREAASPLLAADALLTHAFQAKVEENPEGLDEFAARWGAAGELGQMAGKVVT